MIFMSTTNFWKNYQMQQICKRCKKIIIENWEEWIKENPEAEYYQCPYCACFNEVY